MVVMIRLRYISWTQTTHNARLLLNSFNLITYPKESCFAQCPYFYVRASKCPHEKSFTLTWFSTQLSFLTYLVLRLSTFRSKVGGVEICICVSTCVLFCVWLRNFAPCYTLSLTSSLILVIQLVLGLPLPLHPGTRVSNTIFGTLSSSIRHTCPDHLSLL